MTISAAALAEAGLTVFAGNDNDDGSRTYRVRPLSPVRKPPNEVVLTAQRASRRRAVRRLGSLRSSVLMSRTTSFSSTTEAFTKLTAGQTPTFSIGSSASSATDYLFYNASNGGLFYDPDGNGTGSADLVAKLDPGLAMTAHDIKVV